MSAFEQRVLNVYAEKILREHGRDIDFIAFKELMDAKAEQIRQGE